MPTATTTSTDAMLARLQNEIEDRSGFIDNLVSQAQNEGRDLDTREMELVSSARDRISIVRGQLEPLEEASRITAESRSRSAQFAAQTAAIRSPQMASEVEYRSASGYAIDRWKAQIGDTEAMGRLDLYQRAAAHQTTPDNPGIIPATLLEPILNFVDVSRPIVGAMGPKDLTGSGFVSRVTQHTLVGKQTAEKTELASRKMLITKTPIDADTFGGYVNVSRQNIDWSNPNALDVVIDDLAGQYAIETENEAASVLWDNGTQAPALPADPTSADVSAALWAAAGASYAAMHGLGRLVVAISPDMLGLIGPMFAPINPQNAQSSGFTAGSFGSGANGIVSGISFVMSAGLNPGQMLVINTAAASVYEDRLGPLQVVEPSVLGVQVAYAGYFKALVLEPAGLQKIGVTP
jgi:HK97 family phage major capsid protein